MSWENFVEDQSIFSYVIISLISQPFLLIVYWYFLGEKMDVGHFWDSQG